MVVLPSWLAVTIGIFVGIMMIEYGQRVVQDFRRIKRSRREAVEKFDHFVSGLRRTLEDTCQCPNCVARREQEERSKIRPTFDEKIPQNCTGCGTYTGAWYRDADDIIRCLDCNTQRENQETE